MQGMITNYVLLVVFGFLSAANLRVLFRGRGTLIGFRAWAYSIAIFAVFILVLAATVMGVNYDLLRIYIETGLWT